MQINYQVSTRNTKDQSTMKTQNIIKNPSNIFIEINARLMNPYELFKKKYCQTFLYSQQVA